MSEKRDLSELVAEEYRGLVEVVPGGMLKEAVWAALAFGALGASLLAAFVVPAEWLIYFFLGVLVVQRVTKRLSDRRYEKAMAALEKEGLEWRPEEETKSA